MSPKCKTSDAGSSDILKRSHKVLRLSVRVQALDSIGKKKNSYAEVAKFYSKNKSSPHKVVKEKNCACFFVEHQTKS